MIDVTHLTKSQTPTTVKNLLVNPLSCSLLTNQKQVVLGSFGRLNFNLRGGLGFQNKRTHQMVVGALFSMVLDAVGQNKSVSEKHNTRMQKTHVQLHFNGDWVSNVENT